jgi:hypothetical protein
MADHPNDAPETDGGAVVDERLRCRACNEVHAGARIVKLPDGREVGNYSEESRRWHEAAWVLKRYRSKRTRLEYLSAVEEKRGLQARNELREEMLRVWNWKKGAK